MTRQEIFNQITQAFGFVPGWLEAIPESQLEERSLVSWMGTDSNLSSRDKWLAALGASTAIHCHYSVPKHTEQLRLRGMNESQIQEATKVADLVVGFSEYLHKTNYTLDKWMDELRAMMEHARSQSTSARKAGGGG